MAVRVTTSVDTRGTAMNIEEHDDGTFAYVKDGHLVIERADEKTIALYAPGKWATAVVTTTNAS